jgi:hypothetical protein
MKTIAGIIAMMLGGAVCSVTAAPYWSQGDYDGDGLNDTVLFHANGECFLSLSDSGFARQSLGVSGLQRVQGDFNGDGRLDLAGYLPSTAGWYIRSADGTVLAQDVRWGFSGVQPVAGDFNGNGTDDLAVYSAASGLWYIRELTGEVIASGLAHGFPGAAAIAGDYNGDGTADLAVYHAGMGKWYIRTVAGAILAWDFSHGFPGTTGFAADYNGDGVADLAVWYPSSGKWYIRSLDGAPLPWDVPWGFQGCQPVAADLDADGTNDVAVYYAAQRIGYAIGSRSGGMFTARFGQPIPTDFNGDQRSDYVVVDTPSTFGWFAQSPGGATLMWDDQWGASGMIPVPGDYDADGAEDQALFDPAANRWYVKTATAVLYWSFAGGGRGSTPVPGDYDGDLHADFAHYNATTGVWRIISPFKNSDILNASWGYRGAVPVPGDFDGDGVSDLAVYDQTKGTWFVRRSVGGLTLAWDLAWGTVGASPVSGDYDGDGIWDMALFRPVAGRWYIRTMVGAVIANNFAWGFTGVTPVPGDFSGDGRSDLAVFKDGVWWVNTLMGSSFSNNWGGAGMIPVFPVPAALPEHLPVLGMGNGFLYKPETKLILLPNDYAPGRSKEVNRVVLSYDPGGASVIRSCEYTGQHVNRPKWRFSGSGCSVGNNFYVVAFFTAGGPPQPWLIYNGCNRQE